MLASRKISSNAGGINTGIFTSFGSGVLQQQQTSARNSFGGVERLSQSYPPGIYNNGQPATLTRIQTARESIAVFAEMLSIDGIGNTKGYLFFVICCYFFLSFD